MTLTVEQLVDHAMRLPCSSRAELAEQLVESLDFAESDEIQTAWATEAIRRRDEVRSGIVRTIPGEEVLKEARSLLAR